MTNEQKAEAYKMLLNGASIREVGDKFGVSFQYINQLFPGRHACKRGPKSKCIYPNIANWINENCEVVEEFADKIGICYTTWYLYSVGKRNPTKPIIDKILEVTGMTYEEAFKQ